MNFKVVNTDVTSLTNKLNTNVIPEYMRHQALQIGDCKITSRDSGDINGWLVCDGRSLLRSEYRELYDVIGTDFGSSDAYHFNIPNYTSRAIGMFGPSAVSSSLTTRARGTALGEETHVLTTSEMPAHTHTGTTNTDGAHTHTVSSYPNGIQSVTTGGETACDETTTTATTSSAGAHTHTFTTNSTGGGAAHNNMQPTLFGCQVLILSKFPIYTDMQPVAYTRY